MITLRVDFLPMAARALCVALALGLAGLAGCGGSGSAPDPSGSNSPPPPPPPSDDGVDDGRYVGTVTIDGEQYFGDALFAANGETHLYIGGPYDDVGVIQVTSPEGSISFVSPAQTPSGREMSGAIIGRVGEDCGEPGSLSARWCNTVSYDAEISVEHTSGSETDAVHGEIRSEGGESWALDLTPWSNVYNMPARLSVLAGNYVEEGAPLGGGGGSLTIAEDGDAIYSAGALTCFGEGSLTPLGDGNFNVFEVEMSISRCDYPDGAYNGDYRGLATLSTSSYWGEDFTNVRVWLVRFSPGMSSITLWGRRISDD